MEKLVDDLAEIDSLVVTNAEQQIAPEVAEGMAARNADRAETLARFNQNDLAAEEHREILDVGRELYRSMAHPLGLEPHAIDRMRLTTERKNTLVANALQNRIDAWTKPLPYLDLFFPKPAVTDHSFWWAESRVSSLPPMTRTEFRESGLFFFGGPKVNDYDGEMHTSIGAIARFALQPERMPQTSSGWFLSNPHVELFGGVVAYAPNWDLIQGNGIASCQLVLRQTLFQWKFGPTGPVAGVVGEAVATDPWRLYLKNTGFSRRQDLPGFKPMPPVGFHQSRLAPQELWAELEIRLDIYLNTTGALVWCDPHVLMRTFQWPLAGVA